MTDSTDKTGLLMKIDRFFVGPFILSSFRMNDAVDGVSTLMARDLTPT